MGEEDTQAHAAATPATQAIVKLTVESWRFSRLFARLLQQVDISEQPRFSSQLRYYIKAIEETLASTGLRLVNLEGQPYDVGMAVSAVNLGDFGPDDMLIVEQMLEPVIMSEDGLVKTGTVVLGKVRK